jgi:ATP-dependent RNA helicase RhlE
MTTFSDLGLIEPLLRALTAEGYAVPTPIQAQAIPKLLEGRDMLGIAQTGTGKTAAFALPLLQRLAANHIKAQPRHPRALILTPTRELALQIADGFKSYGRHLGFKHTVVFGGVGQGQQVAAMNAGVDILVATPGRLLDLMNQRHINLANVEFLVLDEADRMLDMGFIRDVKTIVAKVPAQRQTLLFSATMPGDVVKLAEGILRDYTRIEVTPPATTVERIEQRVMFVTRDDKKKLLAAILADKAVSRVLVFTRTKHVANRVAEQLIKSGVNADAIHGNKSQNARQRSLAAFKSGKVRVLVATDIAARGIDVDGITHVINYEMPGDPESYVHRIGRTARAGTSGAAISFCDADEVSDLRAIERTTRQQIAVDQSYGFHAAHVATRNDRSGARPQGQKTHGRPHGNKPQGQRGPKRGGGRDSRDGRDGRDGRGEKPWDNRSAA